MNPLDLLGQTKETADAAISYTQKILDLGVPGILLIFLGLTLFFGYKWMNKLVAKIEEKEGQIQKLQADYAKKVEDLMRENIDINKPLVAVIEKNNNKQDSLETALRKNEEMLLQNQQFIAKQRELTVTLKAELEASRRSSEG